MKKKLIILSLFFVVTFFMAAQSVYFDIGVGAGKGKTEINGVDVADSLGSELAVEMGVDLDLKIGGGPIAGVPLYIVADLGGMGHNIEDIYGYYIQFNSFLIGPGIIFYPIPLLQIAGSAGYSFIANTSNMQVTFYESESGYAVSISAAFDIGKKNHGFLIGAKYFYANNTIEISHAEEESSLICLFLKYAYRHKLNNN